METTQPSRDEKPYSERTKAIITKIESTNSELRQELRDVTKEVNEIRKMMKTGETWRTAAWRAVMNFIGDIKNGK